MTLSLKTVTGCALIFFCAMSGRSEDPDRSTIIHHFKAAVESRDKEEIAKFIRYPLSRKYPLPPVVDAEEFIARFDEVLDEELAGIITSATPDEDWHEMGWRGIMLKDGLVWLDSEGKVIAINHQSGAEQKKRDKVIESIRGQLHSSLQDLVEPVLEWKTRNYRIRIDYLGEGNYRYAAWPVDSLPSQKPAIIVPHGTLIPEGSGGNHHYDFNRGIYTYRCSVYRIGLEETPPGELLVLKKEKQILAEPVEEIIQP